MLKEEKNNNKRKISKDDLNSKTKPSSRWNTQKWMHLDKELYNPGRTGMVSLTLAYAHVEHT